MNDVVNIKGTRHGLLILFDPTRDFDDIRNNLKNKMEAARGFFKGAEFAFYQEPEVVEQKKLLEEICQEYGLIHQPDIKSKINNQAEAAKVTAASQAMAGEKIKEKAATSTQGDTLLVKRSLRSGQQINYPGHVVILGDIHAGAEVIAYGNVMVMGACRGVVHAGAGGNKTARVVAHRLSPAQLRISSSIACSPSDKHSVAKYPEIAYLSPEVK
ncbi:hypothetical protein N752_26255 [Desulforamulus aquiferis]|nr:septum site-determining protein MinC [Desulforamulus aquiferis]RYD02212.1 hypothetical protein N752_26255 [Desulforamulus aquiferis]